MLDAAPGAYTCGPTGAAVWAVVGYRLTPVHVVRLDSATGRRSPLAVHHQLADLDARHVTEVGAIPVVRPEVVVLQLAATGHPRRAAAALDNLWRRRLTSGPALRRTLDAGRAVRRVAGERGAAGEPREPMADRLVAILRQAVRAYQQQPAFARLVMLTATSTDPFASECYAEMGRSVYATLGSALDELDPVDRRRVLDVVGAVWYQALIEWVNDRKTIAQVHEALESAARLVLAGYAR